MASFHSALSTSVLQSNVYVCEVKKSLSIIAENLQFFLCKSNVFCVQKNYY